MSTTALVTDVTIFVLALLVGVEVIGKVPATLHTPLMSAANSMHGIVLAGAMLIAVTAHDAVGYVLLFFAALFAGANVVGGYAVTGRMLKMFRRKMPTGPGVMPAQASGAAGMQESAGSSGAVASPESAGSPGSVAAAAGEVTTDGPTAGQPAAARLARSVLARSGLLGRKDRP